MLDRTAIPPFISPQNINLPKIESIEISDGLNLFSFNSPNLEVFRLEIVFRAGSFFDNTPGDAFFVSKLLNSGTSLKNSHQIAEVFEGYGGFLEISQSLERFIVTLHGMTRFFGLYLEQLVEILENPIFPESELEIQKNIALQNLLVNREKTAFESSRIFREGLFNSNKIGKSLNENDISSVKRVQLIDFWEKRIKNSGFDIFLTGNYGKPEIEMIKSVFRIVKREVNKETISSPNDFPIFETKVEKENSTQTSIRMGRRLINRKHPDFIKFMVTNTIFGGYFGSRLMKNIREEKGLTYGISSSLTPLFDDGIWSIGTDVNKQNIALALKEINIELDTLKNDRVTDEELDRVKNYMSGSIINSMNTPFDVMDKHKALLFEGLDSNFYNEIISKIKAVEAEDILEMSQKYFKDLSLVVVG